MACHTHHQGNLGARRRLLGLDRDRVQARLRGPRSWRWAVSAVAVAAALTGCGASDAGTAPAGGSAASRKANGPLAAVRLYVNPRNPAALQVIAWRASGDSADADALEQIAREPTFTWLTGNQPPQAAAAALVRQSSRHGDAAEIVIYDVPDRDCNGYSAGGARSGSDYLAWVTRVARGIGMKAAILILEPDAIDQAADGCLSSSAAAARYGQLARAITILKADLRAHIYLDAGNAGWLSPQRIVGPLLESGVKGAAGFALNVANFKTTTASIAYGRALSRRLGGRHFVIDTSRNGNGPPSGQTGVSHWCNPPGRALGIPPSTQTGDPLVDAFLWIKYPGESDGQCQAGDPRAGAWWAAYGLELARATQRLPRSSARRASRRS